LYIYHSGSKIDKNGMKYTRFVDYKMHEAKFSNTCVIKLGDTMTGVDFSEVMIVICYVIFGYVLILLWHIQVTVHHK